jgi:serine/threonine protein kinase
MNNDLSDTTPSPSQSTSTSVGPAREPLDKTWSAREGAGSSRLSYNQNGLDEETRPVDEGSDNQSFVPSPPAGGANDSAGEASGPEPSQPYMSFGDDYVSQKSDAIANLQSKAAASNDADKRDELLDTIYVGKYELLSVIGAGGMGVIYLARQIFLDRLVAIKMLKSNLASAKARMRFHQEGKAASALHHPVIVAINDFGIDELDRPYMVMEHVEGVTLSEVIKERITLNIAEAMPIFLELLDGLAVAHSKGIVHRDIKPGNIMLTMGDDGVVHVKLLDFGIAKLLDDDDNTMQSLTKTGEALGTPLYMSPEQIQSHKIDYRSDLYSLGCVMYSCLTGAPPFVGEHKFQTMDLHLTEKPASLKEASLGLDFPQELERVIMRLLEKAPGDRYQSADAVRKILIGISSQLGLLQPSALPGSALERGNSSGHVSIPSSLAKMVPPPGQGSTSSTHGAFTKTDVDRTDVDKTDLDKTDIDRTDFDKTEVDSAIKSRPAAPFAPAAPKGKLQEVTRSYTTGGGAVTERDLSRPRADYSASDEDYEDDSQADSEDEFSEDDEGSTDRRNYGLSAFTIQQKAFAAIGAVLTVAAVVVGATSYLPTKTGKGQERSAGADSVKTPTATVASTPGLSGLAPDEDDDSVARSNLLSGKNLTVFRSKGIENMTNKAMPAFAKQTKLRIVSLRKTRIDNDGLKYLVHLPLEQLWLNGTNVDVDGLAYLTDIPTLKNLYLGNTHMDDRAAELLAKKMKLTTLGIGGTAITLGGIKTLAASPNLEKSMVNLDLSNLDLGNDVFSVLKPLRKLQNLDCSNNQRIDGGAFPALAQLNSVNQLSLASTNISDKDLENLVKMQQLVVLDLSNTKVTLLGLRQLKKLKNLGTLCMGKQVPSAYEQTLKADFEKSNPRCKIILTDPEVFEY